MPGGNGEMASGYVRALAAGSNNEEAAYLFMQWVTAPPLSLVRVMLPYTLRDPYRLSHLQLAEQYRALWPSAKDYLVDLCECANSGVVDMIMPGWQDYALSLDRMCTAVWGGEDPQGRPAEGGGGMGHGDAAARRRGAEGGLSGVPQAARLLRRPHDREARAGGAHDLTSPRPGASRADDAREATRASVERRRSRRRPAARRRQSSIETANGSAATAQTRSSRFAAKRAAASRPGRSGISNG